MGNPHRVVFVGSDARRLAAESGQALSLAENANIEFVERPWGRQYFLFQAPIDKAPTFHTHPPALVARGSRLVRVDRDRRLLLVRRLVA